MNDLGIVNDGALLIHNGVIVESGPSRRIENLQNARSARELDAAGKVVMPAFVDPDAVLVPAPVNRLGEERSDRTDVSLSVLSRKHLESGAAAIGAGMTRFGVLTIGAHTYAAADLRETKKVLAIHQQLQNKPLRVRSIFSPHREISPSELVDKWVPAGRREKLASILELTMNAGLLETRRIAMAAAGAGYSLRIRSEEPLHPDDYALAIEGGAVSVIAPPAGQVEFAHKLAAAGCVQVISAADVFRNGHELDPYVRSALDQGGAFALASGTAQRGFASWNPQFLLYLAVSRFGMSAEEAICAAIWNAACSLRMSHVTGSLEPGKSADLLLVDVPDYRELPRRAGHNDVQAVFRSGQVVYRRGTVMGVD